MELSLQAPFAFGPGVGRSEDPQPVDITFGDGQKVTFRLLPLTRDVILELEEAGFNPDLFNADLTPAEDYKRDLFLAERLVKGWEPGIVRSDGSVWEYGGVEDAKKLAAHAGAMAMVKLAAMQLVVGAKEEREGNSESGSGTTTDESPQSEQPLSAVPAGSVNS